MEQLGMLESSEPFVLILPSDPGVRLLEECQQLEAFEDSFVGPRLPSPPLTMEVGRIFQIRFVSSPLLKE